MVHTPDPRLVVNQVEIYFSVLQRKVVSPNDFTDLTEVEQRLAEFEKRYNATATPFDWKFTRHDLHDLLDQDQPTRTAGPRPNSHPPHDQPPKDFRFRPLSDVLSESIADSR